MKFGEITEKMQLVETLKKIFGFTEKFNVEYQKKVTKLGKAIRREKNLKTFNDYKELPADTELKSEKVFNLFSNLCDWLATQHPGL
jgi:hypothetical protein